LIKSKQVKWTSTTSVLINYSKKFQDISWHESICLTIETKYFQNNNNPTTCTERTTSMSCVQ